MKFQPGDVIAYRIGITISVRCIESVEDELYQYTSGGWDHRDWVDENAVKVGEHLRIPEPFTSMDDAPSYMSHTEASAWATGHDVGFVAGFLAAFGLDETADKE